MKLMSTRRKMQDLFMDMVWLITAIEVLDLNLVGGIAVEKYEIEPILSFSRKSIKHIVRSICG